MAIFAKYEGIDGESKDSNHDRWIDVRSVDWAAETDSAGPTGPSRRRGRTVVEDVVIGLDFEQAAVKLQEASVKGRVIPKLEIEFTATYGGARATYLKYELTNVLVASYEFSASGDDAAGPPIVIVGNDFEKIKVTYTLFADDGSPQGNVETEYKVGGRP